MPTINANGIELNYEVEGKARRSSSSTATGAITRAGGSSPAPGARLPRAEPSGALRCSGSPAGTRSSSAPSAARPHLSQELRALPRHRRVLGVVPRTDRSRLGGRGRLYDTDVPDALAARFSLSRRAMAAAASTAATDPPGATARRAA